MRELRIRDREAGTLSPAHLRLQPRCATTKHEDDSDITSSRPMTRVWGDVRPHQGFFLLPAPSQCGNVHAAIAIVKSSRGVRPCAACRSTYQCGSFASRRNGAGKRADEIGATLRADRGSVTVDGTSEVESASCGYARIPADFGFTDADGGGTTRALRKIERGWRSSSRSGRPQAPPAHEPHGRRKQRSEAFSRHAPRLGMRRRSRPAHCDRGRADGGARPESAFDFTRLAKLARGGDLFSTHIVADVAGLRSMATGIAVFIDTTGPETPEAFAELQEYTQRCCVGTRVAERRARDRPRTS